MQCATEKREERKPGGRGMYLTFIVPTDSTEFLLRRMKNEKE